MDAACSVAQEHVRQAPLAPSMGFELFVKEIWENQICHLIWGELWLVMGTLAMGTVFANGASAQLTPIVFQASHAREQQTKASLLIVERFVVAFVGGKLAHHFAVHHQRTARCWKPAKGSTTKRFVPVIALKRWPNT